MSRRMTHYAMCRNLLFMIETYRERERERKRERERERERERVGE